MSAKKPKDLNDQIILKGHQNPITCLEYCSKEALIVSAEQAESPLVIFWSSQTLKKLYSHRVPLSGVRYITLSADGSKMCVVGVI
jgi:hypothetical protein